MAHSAAHQKCVAGTSTLPRHGRSSVVVCVREEKEVRDRASEWLELLRLEYFPPETAEREASFAAALEHFRERGWIEESNDGVLLPVRDGWRWLDLLTAQVRPALRAYEATFEAVEMAHGTAGRDAILASAHQVVQRSLLLGETR